MSKIKWISAPLGELLDDYVNGFAFKSDEYVESGVPILSMGNIDVDGNFQMPPRGQKYWPENKINGLERFIVNNGDLIIAMTDVTPAKNLIGRMTIVRAPRRMMLNQRVGLLRANKSRLLPEYLKYFSESSKWRQYCIAQSGAGAQANLSTKAIKLANVLIPESINDQHKIISIFKTWDRAIELVGASQGLKSKEFKNILEKLLRESDQQLVEAKLASVADVIMGQSPLSSSYNQKGLGLPLVQGKSDIKNRLAEANVFTSAPTKIAEADSILITVRAPVGYVAKTKNKICIGRGVAAIVPEAIDSDLLYFYLIAHEDHWKKYEQGSTFSAINSDVLRDSIIKFPKSSKGQKLLAQFLAAKEQELTLLGEYKNKLSFQKNGLMQQIFGGVK